MEAKAAKPRIRPRGLNDRQATCRWSRSCNSSSSIIWASRSCVRRSEGSRASLRVSSNFRSRARRSIRVICDSYQLDGGARRRLHANEDTARLQPHESLRTQHSCCAGSVSYPRYPLAARIGSTERSKSRRGPRPLGSAAPAARRQPVLISVGSSTPIAARKSQFQSDFVSGAYQDDSALSCRLAHQVSEIASSSAVFVRRADREVACITTCDLALQDITNPSLGRGFRPKVANVLICDTRALDFYIPSSIPACSGRECDFGNQR